MPIGGLNPNAWNNWYHGMGGTYGTWMRGDPRGFRTFRHCFHVEGDYRNPPPPGTYKPIFEYSKKRMRFPPVKLTVRKRIVLRDALFERFDREDVEVVALAVVRNHFHLLSRFPMLPDVDATKSEKSILTDGRDPGAAALSRAGAEARIVRSSRWRSEAGESCMGKAASVRAGIVSYASTLALAVHIRSLSSGCSGVSHFEGEGRSKTVDPDH